MNILNLFSSVSKMLPLVIEETMDNLSWIHIEDIVEMLDENTDNNAQETSSPTQNESPSPNLNYINTNTDTDTKTKLRHTPLVYTRRNHNIIHQLDDFIMLNESELFDHVTSTNPGTLETENIIPEDGSIANDPTYEELEDTNTYTKTETK